MTNAFAHLLVGKCWRVERLVARVAEDRQTDRQTDRRLNHKCVLRNMTFADGHTVSNAPDLFRPPKLSGTGPG